MVSYLVPLASYLVDAWAVPVLRPQKRFGSEIINGVQETFAPEFKSSCWLCCKLLGRCTMQCFFLGRSEDTQMEILSQR